MLILEWTSLHRKYTLIIYLYTAQVKKNLLELRLAQGHVFNALSEDLLKSIKYRNKKKRLVSGKVMQKALEPISEVKSTRDCYTTKMSEHWENTSIVSNLMFVRQMMHSLLNNIKKRWIISFFSIWLKYQIGLISSSLAADDIWWALNNNEVTIFKSCW